MKVTIRDIMDLPIFKEAKVVAGHGGLDKEIKSVTVAEVPDAADWLKGGELVVTTGYFIKDNKDLQSKWLIDLIEGGASALAIKPDRFLGETPMQMIEIANNKSFCLIELPLNVTWPAVMENVMNAINDIQNQIIRRTEEIHNKLTEIVLRGYGLSFIAKTIAQLVNNIIIVEDVSLTNLAVSYPPSNFKDAENFLSYRLSNEYKHKFSSNKYYMDVLRKSNKDTLVLELKDFNNEFRDISQITMPIVADGIVYGFITLVEFYKEANQVDMVALEHGATTIALEMMKEKIVLETEKRLKRDFLDDLLEGKINSDNGGIEKYSFIGFDTKRPAVAIIINFDGEEALKELNNSNVFYRAHDNKLYNIIEEYIKESDPNAFINEENNRYIVFYHFPVDMDKDEVLVEVKKLCERIANKISKVFPKLTYNFGIGNVYYQFDSLRKSYKEAKKALKIGELFMGCNQLFLYNELGIYRLLFMIDKKDEVMDYCVDTIGSLLEHDRINNDDLCHCLEVFLLNNGNIAKSSKDLFIHPNTLSYRLKKISSLLGKDINDSKTRLNLHIALLIKKYFIDK